MGHAYCGQAELPAAFMTRNRTRAKWGEKAPFHGPEVAVRGMGQKHSEDGLEASHHFKTVGILFARTGMIDFGLSV